MRESPKFVPSLLQLARQTVRAMLAESLMVPGPGGPSLARSIIEKVNELPCPEQVKNALMYDLRLHTPPVSLS